MSCRFVKKHLLDYTEGTIEGEKRNRVQKHLVECDACRQEASLLEKTLTLSQRVSPVPLEKVYWPNFLPTVRNRLERKTRRQRRHLVRLSWAIAMGAFIIVAAAGYWTLKPTLPPAESTSPITVIELSAEDIAAFNEELFANPTEDLSSLIFWREDDIDDLLGYYLIDDGLDYLTGDDLLESISVTDIDGFFDMLVTRKFG